MNIFENYPDARQNEIIEILMQKDNCRIERITTMGQVSAPGFWYEQEEDEFVILLQGEATLEFANESRAMKAGDTINIPAGTKHRVSEVSAHEVCLWLAIFSTNN